MLHSRIAHSKKSGLPAGLCGAATGECGRNVFITEATHELVMVKSSLDAEISYELPAFSD